MADVSTSYKRALIRAFYAEAQARTPAVTLATVLTERLLTRVAATEAGNVLLSNSSNGQAWTQQANIGSFNPVSSVEVLDELLSAVNFAKAYLLGKGIPTPTEAQIFSALIGDGTDSVYPNGILEAITETMVDRSGACLT